MLPLESTCVPLTLGSRTQPGAASGGDLTDRESGRGRGLRPEQGMPMSEMLDTVAPQQQEPLALHDATVLLSPLLLACYSTQARLMEPALDCLHKLIAHGCLRIESGVAGESDARAASGAALAEETMRAICEGAEHDAPGVQLAAVKAALTAATSESFVLNGEALLRAVRVVRRRRRGSSEREGWDHETNDTEPSGSLAGAPTRGCGYAAAGADDVHAGVGRGVRRQPAGGAKRAAADGGDGVQAHGGGAGGTPRLEARVHVVAREAGGGGGGARGGGGGGGVRGRRHGGGRAQLCGAHAPGGPGRYRPPEAGQTSLYLPSCYGASEAIYV